MACAIDEYEQRIKHLLIRGVKFGEVRGNIDVEAAAALLFGLLQDLVNLWVLNNYSFNLEGKFEPLCHIFSGAVSK